MRTVSLGIVTLVVTLIAGLWLMYAPFVIGYQQVGADWTLATKNDLVVAILVVGLSLTGFVGYVAMSLQDALRAAKAQAE
ncbi:MAG: hypothetical protein M1118_01605 [Chloroflexi bacterium]|nr:hypothetical protein [Chloroflexota bacterium]